MGAGRELAALNQVKRMVLQVATTTRPLQALELPRPSRKDVLILKMVKPKPFGCLGMD